ncbi:MAG: alcohol dehydrogenase catalytic domain-containing protein [Ilumatobacteraceae bacterium]
MRRAVWTADGLTVDDVAPPPVAPGFARLAVEACGICGTDLQFWSGHHHPKEGSTPGHEFVGTLLDAPAGTPDQRWSASPMVRCGACEHCLADELNLCRKGGDLIGIGRDGGLAEWVDVPVENLVALGDVPVDVGVLAEPTAVAVRGVGLSRLRPDETVLVLGAGTIGLLAALVARRTNERVLISARYPHQVAAAEALGLDVLAEADVLAWGKQERPSVIVETVGGQANTINDAIRVARRGGRVVVLGTFDKPPVDLLTALQKEVAIVPSFAYSIREGVSDFAEAARVLDEHRDALPALVTHQVTLDDVASAFGTAADKQLGAIKVAVTTSSEV